VPHLCPQSELWLFQTLQTCRPLTSHQKAVSCKTWTEFFLEHAFIMLSCTLFVDIIILNTIGIGWVDSPQGPKELGNGYSGTLKGQATCNIAFLALTPVVICRFWQIIINPILRSVGVVGYHVSLTHSRSPDRAWHRSYVLRIL